MLVANDGGFRPHMADDASGLTALIGRHRAELLRFLIARTGDRDEAEDLLQELWLRVRGSDPGPVANGRAYLFRVANNLVLDRVRERNRRVARDARDWLVPGGHLVVEINRRQVASARFAVATAGLRPSVAAEDEDGTVFLAGRLS